LSGRWQKFPEESEIFAEARGYLAKNLTEADLGLVKKPPEAAQEAAHREEQDENKKWG
jgi:hypothetical protein